VLRHTRNATAKKATLRRSQKASLSFAGTRTVLAVEIEEMLETLSADQSVRRKRITQLYGELGQPVPVRYRSATVGDSGSPLPEESPSSTNDVENLTSAEKKSFSRITQVQAIQKELATLEEAWHKCVLTVQLASQTLTHARKTASVRAARILQEEYPEGSRPPLDEVAERKALSLVPMPKLLEAVVGLELD